MVEFATELQVSRTGIPGLVVVDLPVHGDARGWFKENWQRAKMTALGVDDFRPVQNNISFNDAVGTTRGIHAEPWDKFVSVATGRVFAAWVDLREGPTFGATFTTVIDAARAVFVPRGVGNSYQTLDPDTAYTYLVTDHWSPEAAYTFLNLADETAAIDWPIALSEAEISAKDLNHPRLADVTPMPPRRTLVLGANGQVGQALHAEWGDGPTIEYATRQDIDLADPGLATARPWREYSVIVNAAAYTAVDDAETTEGRALAWDANATGVARLAAIAAQNGIILVHISSDYVFDGTAPGLYAEDATFSPLGVYGQSKAAGDIAAATAPRHYIVRASWVVGSGRNFVRTMAELAGRGVAPRVVDDQRGRLTFAHDIAAAISHLLEVRAPFGTYNLSCEGAVMTWADVARVVFETVGADPSLVRDTSTAEYFRDTSRVISPRPENSGLDLRKIRATGFTPVDGAVALRSYLQS
ncbi:sugar nucleotide-binding protein [uncultured Microbacterium sp.]|uniref:sugar nucleotide-binding protein n=1 Tax=uncultured Microbacterium sp. TaxID=191216 RepID=UPI0037DD8F10